MSAFALRILATGACYYLATRVAWLLCFPDSKVSLFFPPHAVLVSILLLVPTRHWWAYTLAAAGSHFLATQQEQWPPLYALQCEAFDAVKALVVAAGIRMFIKSRFDLLSLREAILFVLVAVVGVPAVAALWGAAFTISNRFGVDYWVEWRNLTISNGVTTIVLVPVILVAAQRLFGKGPRPAPIRILEGCLLGVGIVAVGYLAFDRAQAGPDTSPALLYAPVPFLIWAALRFGLGGISASMLVITVMAIWGTMRGHGPFLAQSPADNALDLQLFLLMAATPLLLLAVAINDERRSKEALRVGEERMRLQREELAHLSRVATLGALSGSLGHELTQPLASIRNNARAGSRFLANGEPDLVELRAIFEDIDSAANRAGGIIDRLRIMLRRSEVALQPVNVNESLDELLRLARSDLVARGVSVVNLVSRDLPPARTDRVQLQQVLLNLIMNACDAMEANSPDERQLTLTAFIEQGEMRIGVLDCGVGLPDDVEALFQPFYTTKAGGLGMGLSICRTLVNSHGGRLWAERRAMRGAAFHVALALAKEVTTGEPATRSSP